MSKRENKEGRSPSLAAKPFRKINLFQVFSATHPAGQNQTPEQPRNAPKLTQNTVSNNFTYKSGKFYQNVCNSVSPKHHFNPIFPNLHTFLAFSKTLYVIFTHLQLPHSYTFSSLHTFLEIFSIMYVKILPFK